MRHTPTKLASIEIVGRAVLIRLVVEPPDSGWPIADAVQGPVPNPNGFWDRYDKRWIVTDKGRGFVSYPEPFWDQFEELCDSGHRRIVLDISEGFDEDWVIEAIVRTYKRVRELDGWMGLVVTDKAKDLLPLTQLGGVSQIFDNRADALAAAESES
jgi:hypothetical protein